MKYNELNKENYNIKKVIIKKEEKFENAPSSYEIAKSTLNDIISNAIDKEMSSEEEIKELKLKVEQLEQKVQSLEGEKEQLQNKVNALEKENETLKAQSKSAAEEQAQA